MFVTFNISVEPQPPIELEKLNLVTEEIPIQNPGGPLFRGLKFTIPEDRFDRFNAIMQAAWGDGWVYDTWGGIQA